MPKQTKEQAITEYINTQKNKYTIKVWTIIKLFVFVILLGASFIAGWTVRSDFSNEVRSEVRSQMSVQLKASQ